TFTNRVGRRERQNRSRKQRRIEKPECKQYVRPVARQRTQRLGRVGSVTNVTIAMQVERGRASDNDEPGNHVGEDAAHNYVELRGFVLAPRDAFFHDRRLQIELHPGRDRSSNHADHHVEVRALPEGGHLWRLDGGLDGLDPGRLGQHSGKYISDVEERSRQEDFLNALVLPFDCDEPDDHGADRHCDVLGDSEQPHASHDADKLAYDVSKIGDQNAEHHKEGNPQAVFFPDQIAQPLAGHRSHAGAHLLHYDQGDCSRDHGPQEHVAELRAGLRIGQDAVGIVVDIRGDEARSYYGKKQQEPELPTSQEFHARRPQAQSNWRNRTIRINAECDVWIDEFAKLVKFFASYGLLQFPRG